MQNEEVPTIKDAKESLHSDAMSLLQAPKKTFANTIQQKQNTNLK